MKLAPNMLYTPGITHLGVCGLQKNITSQVAKFMGPTWGPPGTCWPHVGPVNLAIKDHKQTKDATFSREIFQYKD